MGNHSGVAFKHARSPKDAVLHWKIQEINILNKSVVSVGNTAVNTMSTELDRL